MEASEFVGPIMRRLTYGLAEKNHRSPNRAARADTTRESSGLSTQHRVEPHVLPHLGTLFFVMHQQLSIAEVLAFFLALGGDEEAPHSQAGQLTLAPQSLANASGRFFAERLDDLVVETR